MSRYDAIDLSQLPCPDVVEALDFETILAGRKARMRELLDAAGLLPDWNPDLESDPIVAMLEENAYRELLLRQRVNDGARAVMLATASGADLDQLAALFHVARQQVDAGNPDALPPVPPTYESDTRLRARVLLALEGLSTAGPAGAYVFHALSADPRVADVAVASPAPGEVVVTVLSAEGDGVAAADLLAAVAGALTDEDVRPLTDQVTVQPGARIDYQVTAALDLYTGPDAEVVRAASEASLSAFLGAQRRLGEPVTIDGLHKALRVDGVRKVTLTAPAADIEPAADGFGYCTALAVSIGGE